VVNLSSNFEKPQTRFTRAGSVAIAYQVIGAGPVDLIYASGWIHNIDTVWEHPGYRHFLNELASFSRLILFDKRGTGMSDRDVGAPTLEERAEDIRAVLDAVGSSKATIFGVSEGANMTTMFAATYPERTRSIILIGCRPCIAWKLDWQTGWRRSEFNDYLQDLQENWGSPFYLNVLAPSAADDPEEQKFFVRLLTQSASPASVRDFTLLWYEMDVRSVLPSIACPALVLRRRGDQSVSLEDSKYLAENIPNGRLVELDGDDHLPWIGDVDAIVEEMRAFTLSPDEARREDRVLLSVLMTDIQGSTEAAARMGDARWRDLLAKHDSAAARAIARYDGTLVKSMGDGLLATFSAPSRAVRCSREIQRAASELGLTVRSGIHTGECLRHGKDVTGLAVTIASRVADIAEGGQTLVSSTVRDLVVGSGLEFVPAAQQALKGVPGEWALFKVVGK
jgi:class 3 adenylate cyclase